MAKFRIPIVDANGDQSTAVLTVSNGILDANLTTLFQSVENIILGNTGQSVLTTEANKDAGPGGQPANQFAQREMKWLVRYHNAVSLKNYTLEIATADLAELSAGTEFMNIAAGDGLTFKNQWDAFVLAPDDLAATVLDSVQFVGRNL